MIGRHQLPAYSPMNLRALVAGAAAALGRNDHSDLEGHFRDEWKTRRVVLTNSGTNALAIALRAVVGDTGRTVALPAYACYDIATAAIAASVRVILYDLDPATLAPEPDSLRRALATGPAAIVILHLFGIPVDVASIAILARANEAVVIEDAAQAFGASTAGRRAGTLGSLAVLSFGRGKGYTGGSGGALLANDEAGTTLLHDVPVDLPSQVGWKPLALAAAYWMLARPSVYGLPAALPFLRLGETVFRRPESAGAIAATSRSMLGMLWNAAHESARIRHVTGKRLRDRITASRSWSTPNIRDNDYPSYLRLPVWSTRGQAGAELSSGAHRLGIAPSYPMPLSRLQGFRDRCVNADERLPGAELLSERLLTLPTHELLTESDLLRLERWLDERNAM